MENLTPEEIEKKEKIIKVMKTEMEQSNEKDRKNTR